MIRKEIMVRLPYNVKKDSCLFKRKKYYVSNLQTMHLKNVIVTNNGICFKDLKIIPGTVQKHPDKMRIFELNGLLQIKINKLITFNDSDQYLIIHHPWLNYYHWLTETIPKLWLIKDNISSLILLLPLYYKNVGYVMESLKPFDFKIEYIPDNYNIKLANVVIPQIKPICCYYDPDLVTEIRDFYIDYVQRKTSIVISLGERIYIIRGNSQRRKILNEDDVIKLLEKFGFLAINAEKFSLFEQISLFRKVKYLISNGSGLTNIHFMEEQSAVLELYKKKTNINDFHDLAIWYLASALGIKYFQQEENPIDKEMDMFRADLVVNLKTLKRNVTNMLLSN
jgi:capsular polysaccharide biosynthesis protein